MRQISTISSFVPWCGTPQAVQFAAAWELIGKGDDGAPHAQEAMASLRPGDMAHLCAGDIQEFGKFGPVRGRLVEENQKLAVGEHEPGGIGAQALLHILSGPGHGGGILAEPLPALVEELSGVEILEKQVG